MLAESLEELRQRVMRGFEARIAAAPGSPGGSAHEPGGWLPGALDDLTASLRRGRVEPEHPPCGWAVEPQRCRLGSGQRPDIGVVAGDYGLLGESIFDLIEQDGLDVSPREMRILSGWLSARASAAATGHAEQLRDQIVENARVQQQLRENITEQKRAQEDLAQALAFREQVLGILGHDLRNPLGAVRVLATLLLRREDLPEAVRVSLGEIDRSGERMLEMIGTLLDFTESRVKETLPVAPVPMDMHELCRSVVEELLAANPGRSIGLAVEGDGRGRWDPARLAQVVSNLIGNAMKHGARHGPVSVSVSGNDEDVVLEVNNEGPVISPDLMRVLFEPFRRGSASRDASHTRGLGLGLYIARLIVNAHGGAISVQSTREQGTTFEVRLPRTVDAQVSEPLRAAWDAGADAGP
ncbi:MAG: hypothetical protein A2V77_13065 [Anaeromyxobacter sp. RBG_16_69_14]|nr:MAG: hypothetical protein A2V77_13065 [Anaeromyxobacter sp. RBG_16_69_14]